MSAHSIDDGPGATMRCVWGVLGLFFTFITARVLLADVSSYADLRTDHLLTVGALVGAVVSGVFFGPLLRRAKVVAALGLAIAFSGATLYCLIGSAGRGDERAYAANAEARQINDLRSRYERDRTESKRRWEAAIDAEAQECATGFGEKCKGRRAVTEARRHDFEVADLLVKDSKPAARENGSLKRASELLALATGYTVDRTEHVLALLWPFLPPSICELLSIIFWHQALAHKGRPRRFQIRMPRWPQLAPPREQVIVPPVFSSRVAEPVSNATVANPITPTILSDFPSASEQYRKAKRLRPTDVQLVLGVLEQSEAPLSNQDLADRLGCSEGEASKRLRNCGDAVIIRRVGRYYAISPNYGMSV